MTLKVRTLLSASIGLAVVLSLTVVVYRVAYLGGRQQERVRQEAGLVFPGFALGDVREVELERDGVRTRLRPSGVDGLGLPHWNLIEPVQAEGDDVVVNELLGLLERLSVNLSLELPGDLNPFGLRPARAHWTFTMHPGPILQVWVGSVNPFDDGLYLLCQTGDRQRLLSVDGRLSGPLLAKAGDLRRHNLLAFPPDSAIGIELDFSDRRVSIRRQGLRYELTAPFRDRADPIEVRKLLNVLLAIRAERFLSHEGGNRPDLRKLLSIEIKLKNEEQVRRLQLLKRESDGKMLGRRTEPPGPLAEVDSGWFAALEQVVGRLRSRKLLQFDPHEVSRVKSATASALVVAERRPGGWELVAPHSIPIPGEAIQGLLRTLADLPVLKFDQRADEGGVRRSGLSPPDQTIELFDSNNKRLALLRIGRSTGQDTLVLADSRPWIIRVDGRLLAQLPKKETDFVRQSP